MAEKIKTNAEYPDIFLGAVENKGTFKNKEGQDVQFHNFILNIAIADLSVSSNTLGACGFECLGLDKGADDKLVDKRKVKADEVSNIFGFNVASANELSKYVMCPCSVLWDKKGTIKRIFFPEVKAFPNEK